MSEFPAATGLAGVAGLGYAVRVAAEAEAENHRQRFLAAIAVIEFLVSNGSPDIDTGLGEFGVSS